MKVKMNSQKGEPNVLIKFFCQCQKKEMKCTSFV